MNFETNGRTDTSRAPVGESLKENKKLYESIIQLFVFETIHSNKKFKLLGFITAGHAITVTVFQSQDDVL